MIRRTRQQRPLATAGVAGNDTDALQTDVMRFMSIIGLCLMAVFALVQGIPVQEQGKTAAIAQSSRLREVIRSQQLQLEQLQGELRSLHAIADQAERRSIHVQAQSESLLAQLQHSRTERERLGAELDTLESALRQARQSLDKTRDHTERQAERLAQLEARLQETGQQLEKSHDALDRLRRAAQWPQSDRQQERPAPEQGTTVAPATKSEAPSVTEDKLVGTTGRAGFNLRFASDTALDRLIASGDVNLYAMTNRQAWRASLHGSEVVMVTAEKPRWFHEMTNRTVPAHYRDVFDAVQGGSGVAVTWGVQLPQGTRDAIHTLMRGRRGGELVILANGTVTVEE